MPIAESSFEIQIFITEQIEKSFANPSARFIISFSSSGKRLRSSLIVTSRFQTKHKTLRFFVCGNIREAFLPETYRPVN
jgi:hypothetical protein